MFSEGDDEFSVHMATSCHIELQPHHNIGYGVGGDTHLKAWIANQLPLE